MYIPFKKEETQDLHLLYVTHNISYKIKIYIKNFPFL